MNAERPTSDDVPTMLAIERASHPEPWSEAGLREEIARDDRLGECWVIRDKGKVVAYIVLWFVLDEMQIQNVTTDPAQRRRGYGKALMQAAMRRAEARKCSRVTLEVRTTNTAAIALYGAFGFHEVGRRRHYYKNGDDALLMTLIPERD